MTRQDTATRTAATRGRAIRRRSIRRSLTLAGLLVAAISSVSALQFTLRQVPGWPVLLALDLGQAILSAAAVVAMRTRLRRSPELVAFVFLSLVAVVPLASLAAEPQTVVLIAASLTVVPIGVALWIPWSGRVHALWTAVYVTGVGGFLIVLGERVGLTGSTSLDVMFAVVIGTIVGALGHRQRQAYDDAAFERERIGRELRDLLRTQAAELERLNEEVARTARTDPLTQVGNRLSMTEDLAILGDRVQRYGQGFALVLFDVDRFKAYNDRHGHLAGDDVLRRIARSVSARLRPSDAIYRFGGEEFLVTIPAQGPEQGLAAAERLRDAVENEAIPHLDNPPWGVVTMSAGILAVTEGGAEDVERWLRDVDGALYQAKTLGRNRVVAHGDREGEPPG